MANRGEFYRDGSGEWRWRVRNVENGKTVADSGEGYKHVSDCATEFKHLFGTMDFDFIDGEA